MDELTPEEEYERTVRFIKKRERQIEKLESWLENVDPEKVDTETINEVAERLTDYEFDLAEAKSELPWIRARIGI
jgi:cell division FtsZ-interacting protein ZapD